MSGGDAIVIRSGRIRSVQFSPRGQTQQVIPTALTIDRSPRSGCDGRDAVVVVCEECPGAAGLVENVAVRERRALASAGAELRFAYGWSLAAKFDGEFAGHAQTYAGTRTLRYSW